MAKPAKERFSFATTEDLTIESSNEDVSALQTLLTHFGYLRGSFEPGTICRSTQRAVRRYQRFYGLKSDGIVGPITKDSLVLRFQRLFPNADFSMMQLAQANPIRGRSRCRNPSWILTF